MITKLSCNEGGGLEVQLALQLVRGGALMGVQAAKTIAFLCLEGTLQFQIQWNLSKADTYGTEVFVRFRKVSAFERFGLKSSQI